MGNLIIEVTVKKRIVIEEEKWIEIFDEYLPNDMEEVEYLEDEAECISEELVSSAYLGEQA